MLRSRLACLTKEQMDLFRKACISPTAVSVNEVVDVVERIIDAKKGFGAVTRVQYFVSYYL